MVNYIRPSPTVSLTLNRRRQLFWMQRMGILDMMHIMMAYGWEFAKDDKEIDDEI